MSHTETPTRAGEALSESSACLLVLAKLALMPLDSDERYGLALLMEMVGEMPA
jgi:hypothetical protein